MVLVAITTGTMATDTELEAIVTLAVRAEEASATTAASRLVTTRAIRQLVATVGVAVGPDPKLVRTFHTTELQIFWWEMFNFNG